MVNGRASRVREWLAAQDTSDLVLVRAPPASRSKTGFVQVTKVGNKFQPRFQMKGDGRGGTRKRQQIHLPLCDTAEEAATLLAVIKRGNMMDAFDGGVPPPCDKPHRPRGRACGVATPVAVEPVAAMSVATAEPLACAIPGLPFAACSPVPLPPIAVDLAPADW